MEKLLQLAWYCIHHPKLLISVYRHAYANKSHILQVMAVDMSYRLGWIDESIVKRVYNILQQAKLPTTPPEIMTVEMFKSYMAVCIINRQNFCFETLLDWILSLILVFFWECRLIRRLPMDYLGSSF